MSAAPRACSTGSRPSCRTSIFPAISDQATTAILEPASPAERSYSREKQFLVLALLGGLFLGLALVFLVEVRDDRLVSLLELNEKLPDSVVGQVPEMLPARRKAPCPCSRRTTTATCTSSPIATCAPPCSISPFKGERPKVLLVTSAVPNEGKSTVRRQSRPHPRHGRRPRPPGGRRPAPRLAATSCSGWTARPASPICYGAPRPRTT